MKTKQKKTYEEHRERHMKLHRMLDELCADWIRETGGMPSKATVLDLMNWSHEQTLGPSDKTDAFFRPTMSSETAHPTPEQNPNAYRRSL